MSVKEFPVDNVRLQILLTPKQYLYYVGHVVEHKTMTDIAAQYGVTRAAVSKSLTDARKRVLRYLDTGKLV